MPLPRLQLFELEDFSWFPRTIRDLSTDYLHFMENCLALHQPVVPLLQQALGKTGVGRLIDLCSGGGGPMLKLYEALAAQGVPIAVTLTDKYPNIAAFQALAAQYPAGITYRAEPVDATAVPSELAGMRTMFNAFHHFAPTAARQVLASAVQAQQPIGIFEIPERALSTIIPLFLTPLFVALATPFIRPLSGRRLLWTYLLPLVPLTCWWDGVVSQWRAYTVAELLALTREFSSYDWTAAKIPIGATPGHLTYLLGFPQRPSS